MKSSHKKDYVKMIKGIISPNKAKTDEARLNRSADSEVSTGSVAKNAKQKLQQAKEIEQFNRRLSQQIDPELKDYVREFRKKVSPTLTFRLRTNSKNRR